MTGVKALLGHDLWLKSAKVAQLCYSRENPTEKYTNATVFLNRVAVHFFLFLG